MGFGCLFTATTLFAQQPEKAEYREPKGNYYQDVILPDVNKSESSKTTKDAHLFKINDTGVNTPKNPKSYNTI